jgi:hypothetical protein
MSPRLTCSQLSCHNARLYFASISLIGSPKGSHQVNKGVLNSDMTDQKEYIALRATIRERGTARIYLFAAGFAAWGALTLAAAAMASTPLVTLIPLLVLAALFEAIYALHVGVERIGRYIQVFHEDAPHSGGAHVAMAFGRPKGAVTVDALFSMPFALAIAGNAASALIMRPTIEEIVFVGGVHALFALRLFVARAGAARQRAVDLERFTQLKRGTA